MTPHDAQNRRGYSYRWMISGLTRLQGFTDEGERAAYWRIADEMRNRAILDIGVGPGRTVSMLRSLSSAYVAIDYLEPMVDVARRRHPFADIRLGDARNLSGFADASFALVVFSYNGIDSVGHADRHSILAEVHRVLQPGGVFWFSTLNKDGPAARARPWLLRQARHGGGPSGWVSQALVNARRYTRMPRHTLNYLRGRKLSHKGEGAGEGWSVGPFFASDWNLLVHFTTLDYQIEELERAGFKPGIEVFEDLQGKPIGEVSNLDDVSAFNLLARR
jgi:SAM-dependent methyltransferase